ncbi:MAG: hypothetical protein KDI62_24025 [Anaerolineae bacterium]|nr:hypothetical protein [Anaerolineales bacterium]MCB0181316.1 hypothetical protein [Anaerolineae bacterium]
MFNLTFNKSTIAILVVLAAVVALAAVVSFNPHAFDAVAGVAGQSLTILGKGRIIP